MIVDIITYNAILDAVCTSQPLKARELYCRGHSLYGAVKGIENGFPKLDLHNHSEGAGETAVLWWLEKQVPATANKAEQLIIVTGWGKSRSVTCCADLRRRVGALLTRLGVPTLSSLNKGRFILS